MATVTLKNLSKDYKNDPSPGAAAIQDLCLEVQDREFLVLTGPPGCGDSAVLGLIAGLEEVSGGQILIGERLVNELPAKAREVAYVTADDPLFPHLTAGENLAFGLKARGFPKPEIAKRVRDAAAILGIEALLDRKPVTLSGSDRQRVAIGRAMVRQPKVFLFDAPLSGLDLATRLQMRSELIRLHQRLRTTFIYCCHDPLEALALADRVVVMDHGAVQQVDTPLAIYNQPANLFVAGFVGDPPMNLIRGKLRVTAAGALFKEIGDGTIELKFASRPELEPYAGGEVILGVRPEDLVFIETTEKPSGNRFQCLADLVEPMGAETHFQLHTGAHALVCRSRIGVDHNEAGRRLQFEINLEKANFFDPATSRRIG